MSNNGQSDMAMRSALFSHNTTASEIRASMQNPDARRRVVSGQQLPVAHKEFLDHHGTADARMSHDGISTATDRSSLGYPLLAQAELTNSGSQLHPINEHPEISDSSGDYRIQSLYHPQQQEQQQRLRAQSHQQQRSPQHEGARRNLFSRFKRVAKAVKTAAVVTSKSEMFRKEASDRKPGLYQYQPQRLHQQQNTHFALYPAVTETSYNQKNNDLADGGWTTSEKPTSAPNPIRHTLSVTPIDDSGRILPFSQPGPRQRSLTQQPQSMSLIARVYSENTAQSHSIEISRGLAPSNVASVSSSSIGHNASTSSANSLDPNSRSAAAAAAATATASHTQTAQEYYLSSNMPSLVGSPTHLKRKSPVVSHSSSIISSVSTASGPMPGFQTSAVNRLYDISNDRRQSVSPISRPAAILHSARSTDAIPSLMTTAAFPSIAKPNAAVKKMSQSAFDIYPRRDRSMTLPSDTNRIGSNSASNLSSGSLLSAAPAPPLLPPRSAPKSVARLRSHSVMPTNQGHKIQAISQLPPTLPHVGTEKLDLSISGSPLFNSITDSGQGQSAGEYIHNQAIQNLSMGDLLSGLVSKQDKTIGELKLPPPAAAEKTQSANIAKEEILSFTADSAGSHQNIDSPETDTSKSASNLPTPSSSEVMVDPQYPSMMINSDKLKSYLKQVSDDEQKAEYQAMVSAMERRECSKEQCQLDCVDLQQTVTNGLKQASSDNSKESNSKAMGANNDSGVQVDRDYRGLGAMVYESNGRDSRLKTSSDIDTCTSASASANTSHLSLPAISTNNSGQYASDVLTGSVGSPPSPFSFSHSRYSLINQDGSLNLASFQFDQLDIYQKQLSGSMGSLATQIGSLPQRSESKITDRLSRRHHDSNSSGTGKGTGVSAGASASAEKEGSSGSGNGNGNGSVWFWSSLTSSANNHHERSISPPARSPRLAFGLNSSTGDRLDSFHAGDHTMRQTKLMRRVRKQRQQQPQQQLHHQSFAFGSTSASADLSSMMPTMVNSSIGVFAYMGATSEGSHQQRVSESNSSCDGDRSSSSRRPSNSLAATPVAMNPVYRRLSDNTSVDSQLSSSRQSHPLLNYSRLGGMSATNINASSNNGEYAPMKSNPYLDGRPLQRLMSLGSFGGETPFDLVYRSSMASMSLEQALTLVEGTTDIEGGLQRNSQHTPRHRRLHKRSASALNANELDDIMIQTAEMCHSIQTAIRMQRASESGLGSWIHSVFGEQTASSEDQIEADRDHDAAQHSVGGSDLYGSGLGPVEQSHSAKSVSVVETEPAVPILNTPTPVLASVAVSGPIPVDQTTDQCPEPEAVVVQDTGSTDEQRLENSSSIVEVTQQQVTGEFSVSESELRNVVAEMDPIEEEEEEGESSSESSLDIWTGDVSRRHHLGGDVKSDFSCSSSSSIFNDSIGIQDPVAVVPSPGTLRPSGNCVSSSSFGPDVQK